MKFYKGTILNIGHTPGSGLASIVLENGVQIPCDAGSTFRAIHDAFDGEDPRGQEIVYSMDFMDMCMEEFTPALEWSFYGYVADGIDPEDGLDVGERF